MLFKPVILRLQHMSSRLLWAFYWSHLVFPGPITCSRPLLHKSQSPTYHPSPTSSLLCSGSYSKPTIPRPQHMFYPTSACYAQALTSSPQSYIKPVMCPGSYIKPPMRRIQHMLHPTLSLLCSSPYIHQAGSYIKPVMPRPQPMFLPYIKPVMPRPLHHHPSPISSLL